MKEVYFFLQRLINGEVEQSACYESLEEAMKARKIALYSSRFESVSPVVKGYIDEDFIYYGI